MDGLGQRCTQERVDGVKPGRGSTELQQEHMHHIWQRQKRSGDFDLDFVGYRRVGACELVRGEEIALKGPGYGEPDGPVDLRLAVTCEYRLNVLDGRVGVPRRLLDMQAARRLVFETGVLRSCLRPAAILCQQGNELLAVCLAPGGFVKQLGHSKSGWVSHLHLRVITTSTIRRVL